MIDLDLIVSIVAFGFSCFAFGYTTCSYQHIKRSTDKLLHKGDERDEHRNKRN